MGSGPNIGNLFTGKLPTSLSALTDATYMWVPSDNFGIPYDSVLDHSNVSLPTMQRRFIQPIHGASGRVTRATHEPSNFVRKQWQYAWVCFHVYVRESTSLRLIFVRYGEHDYKGWGQWFDANLMPRLSISWWRAINNKTPVYTSKKNPKPWWILLWSNFRESSGQFGFGLKYSSKNNKKS